MIAVAYHWDGEPRATPATSPTPNCKDLVCRAANALTELGVKGDRVAIYMPMIPETVVAMLACARLGAPHTVVFGGFSVRRAARPDPRLRRPVVITADGGYRRGAATALKPAVDDALEACPECTPCWWFDEPARTSTWTKAVTCGGTTWSTGSPPSTPPRHSTRASALRHVHLGHDREPKGILHTSGGYLTQVSSTHRLVFDIKPESDIFWTARTSAGSPGTATSSTGRWPTARPRCMYEGTPIRRTRIGGGAWSRRTRSRILYTAPTTIRTFMKWGEQYPAAHDLCSLRLLGSVGEPINPEAWIWYRKNIGGERCPVVDTWWQTETGGIMITPLPGITATKPGSAMTPFPGISVDVVDNEGKPVDNGGGGLLVLTEPWPGDAARDLGRRRALPTDLLVTLRRASTSPATGPKGRGRRPLAARPGRRRHERLRPPHLDHRGRVRAGLPPVGGRGGGGRRDRRDHRAGHRRLRHRQGRRRRRCGGRRRLVGDLREHVAAADRHDRRPRQILLTPELPKTRSGKIMRRLLRDVAEHRELGDVTTLADPTVVNMIDQMMADTSHQED